MKKLLALLLAGEWQSLWLLALPHQLAAKAKQKQVLFTISTLNHNRMLSGRLLLKLTQTKQVFL